MSAYTKNLRNIATNLRTEGWDMRAHAIEHAADRMDAMEELITNLMEGENVAKETQRQERQERNAKG